MGVNTNIAMAFTAYDPNNKYKFEPFVCFDNWYLGLQGGFAFHKNMELEALDSGGETIGKEDLRFNNNKGWHLGGAAGYLLDYIRLEVECSYRFHRMRSITATRDIADTGLFRETKKGDVSDIAFLANVIFPVPLTKYLGVHFGGGIGPSFYCLDIETYYPVFDGNTYVYNRLSDRQTLFAWQLIAGGSFQLSDIWAVSLSYRLFGQSTPKAFSTRTLGLAGSVTAVNTQVTSIPITQMINFQLTYLF